MGLPGVRPTGDWGGGRWAGSKCPLCCTCCMFEAGGLRVIFGRGGLQEHLGLLPSAEMPWKENSRSKMVGVKCCSEGRGAQALCLGQPCPRPPNLRHLHIPGHLIGLPHPSQGSLHPPSLPKSPRLPRLVTCCIPALPGCPAPLYPEQTPPAGAFGNPVDSPGPGRCKKNP